jgi:hypothetical protein
MQACPYDALYIDPLEQTAQKCNYCVHRVEVGLEPACVVVCPEGAIIAGDLDDPTTPISRFVNDEQLLQRSPEQGTRPNLWYRGVEKASIDPLGSVDPGDGGIWRDPAPSFMTIDLTPPTADNGKVGKQKHLPSPNGQTDHPPRVVYNTDHPMPWGWRVSSYFLTKGISAGIVMALALSLLLGADSQSPFARWGAPLIAGFFLALTGVLLVADLKRPDRFHYLLTKGNPGSWLVKGAWILTADALVLGLWFVSGLAGAGFVPVLIWTAAVVGLGVAGYTAFLFGQAEGRDLWQSRTLLWHMLAGSLAVGGGAGLLVAGAFEMGDPSTKAFAWALVAGATVLAVIAVVELVSRHPTRNHAAAMHHLTRGAHSKEWWLGGQLLGVIAPLVLGLAFLVGAGVPLWVSQLGGLAALAGIWFADDAFVKAGQSVPLS